MVIRWAGLIAVAGLGVAAAPMASAHAAPSPVCSNGNCTVTFALTGTPQTFVVPPGVTSLTARVAAGSGGQGHEPLLTGYTLQPGGAGGSVVATVPVTPGQTLTIVVGGKGGDASNVTGPDVAGGYGGGGAATSIDGGTDGAGGGGSFLFSGATVLVAAGGGGGGGYGPGGAGGAGGPGQAGSAGEPAAGPGGGGATTSAPGAGGAPNGAAGTGPAAGPGSFGMGASSSAACPTGAAGGGGYFGGGSGGCQEIVYGAGGGGSGVLAAGVTAVERGTNTGDGRIVLSYVLPATATRLAVSPTSVLQGATVRLTAHVTSAVGSVTGSVTFLEGGKSLGTLRLSGGSATLTLSAGQHVGTRTFTARYAGSAVYRGSTSGPARLAVKALPAPAAAAANPIADGGPRNAAPLTGLGVGLVLCGSLLLTLARRRVV